MIEQRTHPSTPTTRCIPCVIAAIDSPVPTLPLLTSLQHLAYLTSTSPRIREILTVDGGLERLISIVETCIDIAYPERARKGIQSTSTSSSNAIASTSTPPARDAPSVLQPSRPTSSDRKGKQPERREPSQDGITSSSSSVDGDELKPHIKKLVPFKAFSAYAKYPFSLDSDSDEETDLRGDDANMDVTPSNELDTAMLKTQRTAMTAHEREIRLLQLEKSFMRNFVTEYKDLPALVHTYGFALQCLVNVGVRGSESIRTRVVEAGVLGVVARILGGFLDYRATEREKRQKLINTAQAEKEKEKELSIQINGSQAAGNPSRRDRHANTSGESDVTAVLSMTTRRERRERDSALMVAQAQTLAMAQAQISAHQHQYSLAQAQAHGHSQHATPLVAGMPAPPNAAAAAGNNTNTPFSMTLATPRQTRSAAVQALLNSNTEIPTRALGQYTSAIVPPTPVRISPRRAGSGSSIASSSSQAVINLSSTTSSSSNTATTVAAISSLVAGSIMINRTNTPDTIASLDEVQEFSDVNPDENESTTGSGQEEASSNNGNGDIDIDSMMDVIGSNEFELQSTSAMVLGSTMISNPASRSVSRNRINGHILAQHRPIPPPPSSSSRSILEGGSFPSPNPPVSAQLEASITSQTVVQAPPMIGDITIKFASDDSQDVQVDVRTTEEEEDVVMERDNDREDQESTDDTGTSASPVSRPTSSHYIPSPSSHRVVSSATARRSHHLHYPAASVPQQQMARSESASSLNGMIMDSETTPISRPIPLRRQSSASAANVTTIPATPRNAFSNTAVNTQNTVQPTSQLSDEQQVSATGHRFVSHASAISSQLESHLRSQTLTSLQVPSTTQDPSPSSSASAPLPSSTSTIRQPHTSTHAHLRLHPHLQESTAAQPAIIRDGHAHLLLNYGPLMDHYIKEEDVLHCLHLLAYLSKYPHVRAVFHDPENEICRPPSTSSSTTPVEDGGAVNVDATTFTNGHATGGDRGNCCSCARKKAKYGDTVQDDGAASSSASAASLSAAEDGGNSATRSACNGHCHAHAQSVTDGDTTKAHSRSTSSGSQKHAHPCCAKDDHDEDQQEAESLARARAMATMPAKDRKPALEPSRPPRSTVNNVFSLVEQYTFRPSSPADRSMRLGTDIQYWAGVIMRNACRKDELRGGIRQCANMGCGVWERFPREFAKCRRCRKAKYCSKGCQRRAWQAGHR